MTEDDEAAFDEFLAARSTALPRTAILVCGASPHDAHGRWLPVRLAARCGSPPRYGPTVRYGSRDPVRAVPACRPWRR